MDHVFTGVVRVKKANKLTETKSKMAAVTAILDERPIRGTFL
jgi:hypothetical protein